MTKLLKKIGAFLLMNVLILIVIYLTRFIHPLIFQEFMVFYLTFWGIVIAISVIGFIVYLFHYIMDDL